MTNYREFVTALRKLEIERSRPVIAHVSMSSFGAVRGGADTLLGALSSIFHSLVMPTFTYKAMLTPEDGPANNAMVYGSGKDANRMAEFFTPEMPADRLMGAVAETLRRHPQASRSSHPILSFAGMNAEDAIRSQTLGEPLDPIRELMEAQGWVLLLGVNHSVNTSIHYAERLAGRKQFVRWALTAKGVQECPGFPGCSNGFQALEPHVEEITQRVSVGPAIIQALPLAQMVEIARALIVANPLALLCDRSDCERCQAVQDDVMKIDEF
jgi:aminoglycoside 3-N-acetyltransferase